MVNISLRVLYRPKIDMLAVIVKTLGMEYEGIVFGRTQDGQDGVGNEVLKEVVAQFTAEELLQKREFVSARIAKALAARAANFHIDLDDVSITHLSPVAARLDGTSDAGTSRLTQSSATHVRPTATPAKICAS